MGGVLGLLTLPLVVQASRSRRMWHELKLELELELELEEKHAKFEGSEAPNFSNHPKQNLVKGRRTVENEWCEFLSKKHEECARLDGSDKPLCDMLKNCWLKDCATLDGKPKQVFVEGERHR